MAKFYIISDVHGFYKEMKAALDIAGFDPNDENSWLISLGDELDRGPMPEEVISYLMSLPRAIFVRGNHQQLMEEMLQRGYPLKHDWQNGTMGSVLDLAPNAKTATEAFAVAYEKLKPFFAKTVDYVELRNHILVHSFVPLKNLDGIPGYYTSNRKFAIDQDWRYAHTSDWNDARWGNPFLLAEQGFLPNKKLVFGHWGTYEHRPRDYEGEDLFDIYYGDGYIGIDATTALSGKCNVLVLEDEFF
jgi:serine/threonine protein phosphatase 1